MYLRVLELIRRLDISIEGEGQVRVLRLQHGDAEEMATTLNAITGGRAGGAPGGPPGAAGASGRATNAVFEGAVRITADKASNALVVTSSPRDYAALRRVIDELDRSRRQVFIEAVVMELSVNHTLQAGAELPRCRTAGRRRGQHRPRAASTRSTASLLGQDALSGLALGLRGPALSGSQNLLPGVGISIPAFGVTLNALASSGDANVLVDTAHHRHGQFPGGHQRRAERAAADQRGRLRWAASPGAAGAAGAPGRVWAVWVALVWAEASPRRAPDVGTKIHLVPHINDSNEIRMEIDEEISEVGATAGGTLGAVTINRRTAKTTVVVRDQNTMVIGGLIRNADTNTETRIPILGDIPIIGALFRQSSRTTQRSNLLLFLTPYVIRDQSDLRRIFERKMRERQEFIDRYFVFSGEDYAPAVDYSRTNGIVEEIRQSIRELRVSRRV